MRIMISGGGTGGHIYPGLALADKLKTEFEDCEILFVGSQGGMETDIIPREGYQIKTIELEGLPRKISLGLLKAGYKSFRGLFTARRIIKDFKPDIIVGTGGYVSGALVLTAALLNLPTIVHEQNAYPGLTNRLLAKLVDKVALTSPAAKKHFKQQDKLVLTGNPIRPEILKAKREESFKELGFDRRRKLLLVFGGSRGAKSINQATTKLYQEFKQSSLQLLHVSGKRDFEMIKEQAKKAGIKQLDKGNVVIKPYLYQMAAGLAAADLVICRAGATALAEITACGLPAVLIPFPHAAENHQEHNARALEEAGAAEVILDDELTGDKLAAISNDLISDSNRLAKMSEASKSLGKPKAAENLVELVKELS